MIERLLAQELQPVGDVARAAAVLAPQVRHQERDVQDVDLVGEDVVLELVAEHHDGVVRDGAADEDRHAVRRPSGGAAIIPARKRLPRVDARAAFARWAALTAAGAGAHDGHEPRQGSARRACSRATSRTRRRTRSETGQTHRKVGTQSLRSTGPAARAAPRQRDCRQASLPAAGSARERRRHGEQLSERQRRFPRRACARPRAPHAAGIRGHPGRVPRPRAARASPGALAGVLERVEDELFDLADKRARLASRRTSVPRGARAGARSRARSSRRPSAAQFLAFSGTRR